MKWHEIAQLILTMVTAAVASAIGVATFFLDREVKLASTELQRLSQQMAGEESERAFSLELFRLVLESLETGDDDRQNVLVAYFEALDDSPFKERMLVWFRSRATSVLAQKDASRSLGREGDRLVAAAAAMPDGDTEIAAAQTADDAAPSDPLAGFLAIEVESAGDPKGWDFDVFACETSLRQEGDTLIDVGREVVSVLAGLPGVGSVRPRVLRVSELPPGYYMIVDAVAAEQDKAERVGELLRDVEPFELRPNQTSPSPWYISLFLCPA
jgi:hypothetical protein